MLALGLFLAALVTLAGLLLPLPWLAELLPASGFSPEPFNFLTGLALSLLLSLALVLGALLVYHGHSLYRMRDDGEAITAAASRVPRKAIGWKAVLSFSFAVVLVIAGLHTLYWLLIWDSTYDSLNFFWLYLPLFWTWVAGLFLLNKLKAAGAFYTLLVTALLILVAISARQVDFRQLTVERAGHIVQALESYQARHGTYPESLSQLTPWTILSLPEPVVIFGQPWCYEGGDDYYRLGYVYREHWSDRGLVGRLYQTEGDTAELSPICAEEIARLQFAQPSAVERPPAYQSPLPAGRRYP